MAAGLPGAGVSALFLILSALLMPLVELQRRARRRTARAGWRPVRRHAALAVGMVTVVTGAIGVVHWALMGPSPTHGGVSARAAGSTPDVALMSSPVSPVLMTLALLGSILTVAYMLRLIHHGPGRLRKTGVSSGIEPPGVESCDFAEQPPRGASTRNGART